MEKQPPTTETLVRRIAELAREIEPRERQYSADVQRLTEILARQIADKIGIKYNPLNDSPVNASIQCLALAEAQRLVNAELGVVETSIIVRRYPFPQN